MLFRSNSCARIQTADIGLKGSLVAGPDGRQVEGFQVHLGGSLGGGDGSGSGFGRKVRGLKTTAEELPDYVERVLRRFDAARQPGESFAAWTMRASDEELSWPPGPSPSTALTAARKTSNRRAQPTVNGIAAVAHDLSSYALPE